MSSLRCLCIIVFTLVVGCGQNPNVQPSTADQVPLATEATTKTEDMKVEDKQASGELSKQNSTNDAPLIEKAKSSQVIPMSVADLVEKVEPSVVVIEVTGDDFKAIGSGFVISPNGTVVTNHHVIENATKATARFSNGKTADVLGILFSDEEKDLAIVQLSGVDGLPVLKITDQQPRKGEQTVAFGAPKGLEFTASDGIVSAIRMPDTYKAGWPKSKWLIQTTAPISSGNSGGPLMNLSGEVIGINTFVFVAGQNLNFALSGVDAIDALQKLSPKPQPFAASKPKKKPVPDGKKENEKIVSAFQSQIASRKESMDRYLEKIEARKRTVRESMIAGDSKKEEESRETLADLVSEYNKAIDRPFDFPKLSLRQIEKGNIGVISTSMSILQVLNKAEGVCLATNGDQVVRLRGVDLTNVVDRDRVNMTPLVFEVLGTATYSTVNGATNTVFELEAIQAISKFDSGLLYNRIERVVIDPLNEEESKKRSVALAARAELDATTKKADMEAKAASKLELAKKFLTKGDKATAKKWFLQTIKDYPASKAATEAEELLKKAE